MLRTVVRLWLAALVALGGMLLVPTSAHACSCVSADPRDFARWADVVLVGTVRDRDVDRPFWGLTGDPGQVTYGVAVDRVLKGTAGTPVFVESAVSGATCGVDLSVGQTYLLYAEQSRDGGLSANLCGGTDDATPASVHNAESLLGPASPPETPGGTRSDASGPSAPGGPETPVRWLASGAALTGSLLVAAVLGVLLRRRRSTH